MLGFSPSWYALCRRANESIDHILLHCDFAKHIWSKALVLFGLVGVFPKKWSDFLIIKWYFKQSSKRTKHLWRFSILAIAWLIWSERNRRIFEDKISDPLDIWELFCFLVGQWAKA